VELNTGSQEHGIQNAEEDLDGGKSKKKKNKKKRLEKCRDDGMLVAIYLIILGSF